MDKKSSDMSIQQTFACFGTFWWMVSLGFFHLYLGAFANSKAPLLSSNSLQFMFGFISLCPNIPFNSFIRSCNGTVHPPGPEL